MNAIGNDPHASGQALPLEPVQARAVVARLNAIAGRFYCDQVRNSWVPGYLRVRGFGLDVLQRWHVGYAPATWDALTRHLRNRGCPETLIEAVGLARRSQSGRLRDTFRDRVMLPIRSPSGIIAGFIGRAPADASPRVPKYLNSPRTCLYDKGATLFGLWEGRAALRHGAQPVIVEGPFDAIAVTTAGQPRHVGLAPCGTALTSRHVSALGRQADLGTLGVMVAFDNDMPGRQAGARAYHLLRPTTEKQTMATFPAGQDAAQILAERGPAALARLLASGNLPLTDLIIDQDVRRWARWLEFPEGRVNAMRSAARLIASMPPSHIARQVARLADHLSLDYALVTEAVTEALPAAITANSGDPREG